MKFGPGKFTGNKDVQGGGERRWAREIKDRVKSLGEDGAKSSPDKYTTDKEDSWWLQMGE